MTFDAREAAKSQGTLKAFPFVGLDSQEYELPNIRTVETAVLERFQGGELAALAEIAGDEVYDAIIAMPNGVSEQLITAWAEHGGMAGKAPSGSSATKKPGKPRKRT